MAVSAALVAARVVPKGKKQMLQKIRITLYYPNVKNQAQFLRAWFFVLFLCQNKVIAQKENSQIVFILWLEEYCISHYN